MPDAGLYKSVQWPLAAVIATGLVYATIQLALSLPGQVASFLDPIVLVILVFVAAWAVMRVVRFLVENLAKGAVRRVHEEDEVDRQRMLTQVTVVRHVLTLLVVVVALGVVLAQLNIFRSLGIALISSAGAAAVVLGIAGHAVLGNLIAGLQIALTQPLRLNDSVYIEDNWGRIEDITYTYVVVRTWDFRRLVIPIKYFINNWFENWSLTDPFLTKPIYLHVDYRADVQAIREKFLELVKADDDWDREHDDPQVLVYETKDQTLLVRLTCGAADPSTAWDLHCRVREQLVAWLQGVEDGRWLPRQRVDVASTPSERAPGER